ncbi:MAG: hypothetical protein R6U98_07830 [Pirellulaceae bacterium]
MNHLTHQLAPRKRPLSSWLLSVCVHLGLLILLAQLIRSPESRGLPNRGREVGIALADTTGEAVEYFDEVAGKREFESGEERGERPAASQQDALPSEEALAEIPQLDTALPGRVSAAPGNELLGEVDYAPSRRGAGPSRKAIAAARAQDALMREQRESRGPTTEVSLFGGAPAAGNSFLFILDRSDSMGRHGLGVIARAKDEFQRALSALDSAHRFQIVAYNHQCVFFGGKRELLPASDSNKERVGKFMGGLAAFGATNHFSALMSGLHRSPDVLFLLTDGGDPTLSHPQVVRILKQARGQTSIHCIQFGRRPLNDTDNFMSRLARETGGAYRYLKVDRQPMSH